MTRVTLTAASTWLVLVALVALQTQALRECDRQLVFQASGRGAKFNEMIIIIAGLASEHV